MSGPVMMQKDWDERARKDAFHYIASWQESWTAEDFFQSGEKDYQELVAPVLSRLGFDPTGKEMLELGCGVGRLTRSFSRRLARVLALDVSAEMLRKAQELHSGEQNIVWIRGNGTDLEAISTAGVDFVCSYLVLHHIPEKTTTLRLLAEMMRVLRNDGVFLFQFNSKFAPTMNWKGRLVWGVIDRLREPVFGLKLGKASVWLASFLGLDPLAAGRTWRGAAIDVQEVLETLWASGAVVAGVTGWGTPFTWCFGRKQSV